MFERSNTAVAPGRGCGRTPARHTSVTPGAPNTPGQGVRRKDQGTLLHGAHWRTVFPRASIWLLLQARRATWLSHAQSCHCSWAEEAVLGGTRCEVGSAWRTLRIPRARSTSPLRLCEQKRKEEGKEGTLLHGAHWRTVYPRASVRDSSADFACCSAPHCRTTRYCHSGCLARVTAMLPAALAAESNGDVDERVPAAAAAATAAAADLAGCSSCALASRRCSRYIAHGIRSTCRSFTNCTCALSTPPLSRCNAPS